MRSVEIPRMFHIRQHFHRPRIDDYQTETVSALQEIFSSKDSLLGKRIAIGVGSRGISNIQEIVRTVVGFLKEGAAQPFIVPAMGSHGGATAEGQKAIISHYGITEENLGVPIRAEMDTHQVGIVDGVAVYCAECAWDSDGILLVNRIKPHTDFQGSIESGLCKMAAIGFGKCKGAEEHHAQVLGMGLERSITTAAEELLRVGRILGGVAMLENAYHETARIVGVSSRGFIEKEKELLKEAKDLMPSLPLNDIDVLYIQQLGKNISGTGIDTNIVGRSPYAFIPGQPWYPGCPSIFRIVLSQISEQSNGNALGMGIADFITERFRREINYQHTYLNAITANAPREAMTPPVFPDDVSALQTAIATCRKRDSGPLVCCIQDTLRLGEMLVSEAAYPVLKDLDHVEILSGPEPLSFDQDAYLCFPCSDRQT